VSEYALFLIKIPCQITYKCPAAKESINKNAAGKKIYEQIYARISVYAANYKKNRRIDNAS